MNDHEWMKRLILSSPALKQWRDDANASMAAYLSTHPTRSTDDLHNDEPAVEWRHGYIAGEHAARTELYARIERAIEALGTSNVAVKILRGEM